MILSERLGFAFIHIPKCAGTTVRGAIERFDESYGRITAGKLAHSSKEFTFSLDGGQTYLDFHHLTLDRLRKFYPEELERLRKLRVFALLRDPRKRLLSSVMQRLKQFFGIPVADVSLTELKRVLMEDIKQVGQLLDTNPNLPFDYIHFQPQSHFVELDGERFVSELYTTGQIELFERELRGHLGGFGEKLDGFASRRANPTRAHRFEIFKRLAQERSSVKDFAKKALPAPIKSLAKQIIYTEQKDDFTELLAEPWVEDFLQEYYSRDLKLFNDVRQRAQ